MYLKKKWIKYLPNVLFFMSRGIWFKCLKESIYIKDLD